MAWKRALRSVPTNAGPGALLNADLSRTPQFDALSGEIQRLRPWLDLLSSWKPSQIGLRVSGNADARFFQSPAGADYVIAVNNDLLNPTLVTLSMRLRAQGAKDLTGRYAVSLAQTSSFLTVMVKLSVTLGPGDGVLLEFKQ